jgi:hypothetical protein
MKKKNSERCIRRKSETDKKERAVEGQIKIKVKRKKTKTNVPLLVFKIEMS